VNAYFAILGI
jgi:hypothetical protein